MTIEELIERYTSRADALDVRASNKFERARELEQQAREAVKAAKVASARAKDIRRAAEALTVLGDDAGND